MRDRKCPKCKETLPSGSFRKYAQNCVWCTYSAMETRAKARYSDKKKGAGKPVNISKEDFINWYESQKDCCAYCGLTFAQLKALRIKRGGGYCVSWDIDRLDSSLPYQKGNLALSCFVCNMAKGDQLTPEETKEIGKAVGKIWKARLKTVAARP